MKKVAIVTATRAEYGILVPLINAVNKHPMLELQLYVTGTHLSPKYGNTINEIENDRFPIFEQVPILENGNTAYDVSCTMANALKGFAKCFHDNRADIIIILGDRTEMLGVASAAMNEQIPIAHICGGEITEGAVDDCVRHAISKMSYLHFTSTQEYQKRVIQMGEEPERVYNVGSLSTENILHTNLMSEEEIKKFVDIDMNTKYAVVTFHPVTLEQNTAEIQTIELCKAMEKNNDYFFLLTKANADVGGNTVNRILQNFVSNNKTKAKLVASLGMKRYLSAVKFASFVLGNSSSGIIEAPVLGTPTVNIGDRQRGRIMVESIINCEPDSKDISRAIKIAGSMTHKPTLIYGDGHTSEKIIEKLIEFFKHDNVQLKKRFYDLKC